MKVTLFDFQKDALGKLREALVSARKSVSSENQQVIAFSAYFSGTTTTAMLPFRDPTFWSSISKGARISAYSICFHIDG